MLQQTQARRVVLKYEEFLRLFPDFQALSQSTLKDVYAVWQGMGYNRRAKYLFESANMIQSKYQGVLPQEIDLLQQLPGIGYNTACSIAAFAYNKPVVFIETNIRSVFIHEFFTNVNIVADKEILLLVEQTLDKKNPRQWYYALMDYGNYLKKLHSNPSRKSMHFKKQSRFEGSDRQMRGKILRLLLQHTSLTVVELKNSIPADELQFNRVLSKLLQEKVIVVEGEKVALNG